MRNQIKLLFLLLLALPLSGRSAFYIEPRVSAFILGGEASIGDLGTTVHEDLPSAAFGLIMGCELSPKVSLEVRFAHLDDVVVTKVSSNWAIFPGEEVLLPAVRKYEYSQSTKIFSAALPIRVLHQGRFTLQVTPLLQYEDSDVTLTDIIEIMPALPNQNTLPQRWPILSRHDTGIHLGAEVSVNYEFTSSAEVRVHYNYSPVSNLDAHFLGAGLVCRF